MRSAFGYFVPIIMICAPSGCALDPVVSENPGNGGGNDSGAVTAADSSASQPGVVLGALQTALSPDNSASIRGNVGRDTPYELFDLGPARPGEEWQVGYPAFTGSGPFTVAIFDADQRLLQRAIVSPTAPLKHIVRRETSNLQIGVGMAYGSYGGNFDLRVQVRRGVAIPATRPQLVYLNFDSGKDVRVHVRSGLDFPAFDGEMLGPDYSGTTDVIRNVVVSVMRDDYAQFNVTILSSLDGPPPAEPHATIHFGGEDPALLGLADNVDSYNADPGQSAVVYVAGFADFASMGLTAEQMGLMIGNVGSHELGHLLGLYHTRMPVDVMDTTGTAWDLADGQEFSIAPLESSVFPIGFEDSPRLLEDALGRNAQAAKYKTPAVAKLQAAAAARKVATEALRGRCGTCLHLDDAAAPDAAGDQR